MATSRDKIKDKGRIINCFAYREDQCATLKDIYCIKEDYQCPFYKTRKEYKEGNKDGWAEFPIESED